MLSCTLENMKNALKDKFKSNILVKPLYRKLKTRNKIKPKIVYVDSAFKLDGDGISVRKYIVKDKSDVLKRKIYSINDTKITLCDSNKSVNKEKTLDKFNKLRKCENMLCSKPIPISEVDGIEDKINKFVQADNEVVVIKKVSNTWLRLYPLPQFRKESVLSVIFRCILSQFGLFSVLIFWTVVWVFVIHSFEGPNEIKVSTDFEKEQNLLVIDLATELRQIAPLSPKWKNAIERRMQDERHLTMQALSRGARVHPGQFWDLSGTFLFTVYVMTALGFGAPVPHTLWGRTSALIYAMFAVPTHIYLVLNASMFIVVQMETYLSQVRCKLRDKPFILGRTTMQRGSETTNCSRSSDVLKAPSGCGIGKKIMVEGHVRILYGLYVEGAMMILACGLATMRRHSGAAITCMAEKYKLFQGEEE